MPEQRSSESEKGNLPRPRALLELIRFLASESSHVILTEHAMDRMDERDITTKMIFDVLRKGTLCGGDKSTVKAVQPVTRNKSLSEISKSPPEI